MKLAFSEGCIFLIGLKLLACRPHLVGTPFLKLFPQTLFHDLYSYYPQTSTLRVSPRLQLSESIQTSTHSPELTSESIPNLNSPQSIPNFNSPGSTSEPIPIQSQPITTKMCHRYFLMYRCKNHLACSRIASSAERVIRCNFAIMYNIQDVRECPRWDPAYVGYSYKSNTLSTECLQVLNSRVSSFFG